MTRILIAEDHAILRAALKALLEANADLSVVGEATDGAAAVAKAAALRPDVVLMDVSMPVMDGITATSLIRLAGSPPAVVALSAREDSSYVQAMLDAGAKGYVFKRSAASELVEAIRAAVAGACYLDSSIDRGSFALTSIASAAAECPVLSVREEAVLRLFACGYGMKEISNQLDISIKTAETYKKRACEKLGLRTRAALVRHAIAQRWLAAEE